MYPSHDTNPFAVKHMRDERPRADVGQVDRGTRWEFPAAGLFVALAVVAVAMF